MSLYVKNSLFLPCTLLLLLVLNKASAQFKTATLGINGLTCSLCSYSVEKELEKVDCIAAVEMDLNQNIAKLIFEENIPVDMKAVVNAVYKAGFSVGYTQALFNFDNVTLTEQVYFLYEEVEYRFVNTLEEDLQGEHIIKFIDKKFVVDTVFKTWKEKIKLSDKKIPVSKNTVYHISL